MHRKKLSFVVAAACCLMVSGSRPEAADLTRIPSGMPTVRPLPQRDAAPTPGAHETIESSAVLLPVNVIHRGPSVIASSAGLISLPQILTSSQPPVLLTRLSKDWTMVPVLPVQPAIAPVPTVMPQRLAFTRPEELNAGLHTGVISRGSNDPSSAAAGSTPPAVSFPPIAWVPGVPIEVGSAVGEPISDTGPAVVPLPAPLALGAAGLALAAVARRRWKPSVIGRQS